jgi:murein DD-endopeptidase MepM/ murein hydrolase activator NlpD
MVNLRTVSYLIGLSVLAACTAAPTPQYIAIPPIEEQPSATTTRTPLAAGTPEMHPTFTLAPTATAVPRLTVLPTPTPLYPYVFPIDPGRSARFKQGGHAYPATDIFAVAGTKYVAATNGVIDYVTLEDLWDPANDNPALRGGISVSFIGDDGWVYYGSHLEAVEIGISVGVRIKAGQVLGYVGNTGNARETTSHVHFGISYPNPNATYKNRIGEIDPYPCLTMWLQGFRCTPQP